MPDKRKKAARSSQVAGLQLADYRTQVHFATAQYEPYLMNGKPHPGLFWRNISHDAATGTGLFLIKFEPGAASAPHVHHGYEEFVILDGELTDSDGARYAAGDCVSLKPGSSHHSVSHTGCIALVFARGALEVEAATPSALRNSEKEQ
jgi:anti-sigma factor ChrR (cupin superfamily)